jgi:gamma-glutamylcyclotransferase (GGCT)/AIG2-like uncharacterized protein YtfP
VTTTELLFVYGSLKRGARHHDELGGAPFRGLASTDAGYALVGLGPEPSDYLALVEEDGAGCVEGELFEVDAPRLALLDEFEGDGYRRAAVRLRWGSGAGEKCEIRFALAYLKRTR